MAEKEKISTILLKVDLDCCRCSTKIRKVLCKLQKRENIQTIAYDEKKNTVKVSGPFDPLRLSKKLLCLACDVIKGIEILPPPPPPPPPKPPTPPPPPPPPPAPPPPPPPCLWPPKVLCPYPLWQCPPPPPPPPPPAPPPPPPPRPPPPPPPPQCPWPPKVECPFPEWPGCCRQPCPCPCPCSEHQGGRGGHRCCSCGKTDSGWCPPPGCRHCGGAGGCSWCAGAGCKIVFEGDSPYGCATM